MGPIDNVQIMGNGSDDSKIFQSFLDSLYATELNGNNLCTKPMLSFLIIQMNSNLN